MSTKSLGLDIGATNIRYGILAGDKLEKMSSAQSHLESPERLVTQCGEIIESNSDAESIGIVTPGPLDRDGVLHNPPNFPHWGTVNFREALGKKINRPFTYDRDSVAALIGEWKLGVAKGAKNVVLLTIGTGIGGAAIVNGAILRGHHGFSGEFGHMLVGPKGRQCGAGHDGCAEAWASGRAMENGVSVEQATDVFVRLLLSLEKIFDPEMIVLAGGIVEREDYVTAVIAKAKNIGLQTDVKRAKLGEWSGAAGAALLAQGGL